VITVVALGGHLLAGRGDLSARDVVDPFEDTRLVLTHGNGPQVGAELERDPAQPFDRAVAKTQAEIGGPLALDLGGVCVLTHVVVDEDDPAFAEPTKPIGPSYGEDDARRLAEEQGWTMAPDGHRGWRRFVPSPAPREIVELETIRRLAAAGTTVVAAGGGGIPVAVRDRGYVGVAAVIDKDRASALLAQALGADAFVVLTDVDAVYRGFRSPSERAVSELTVAQAETMLPELPAGSMRPKVEACASFTRATGRDALITSARALPRALAGAAGTRIKATLAAPSSGRAVHPRVRRN
jgi:carbamate kinase